nr:SpoIIE family protein phosphatase [Desulfobacterales bacterium]
ANFLANLAGVGFVQVLSARVEQPLPESLLADPLVSFLDMAFSPFAFTFIMAATLIYETPVRRCLRARFTSQPIPERLAREARRRLLNEPFVTVLLDLSMWGLAALLFALTFHVKGAGAVAVERALFNSLSIGAISVTLAFFLQEHVLRRHLAPVFFPAGGLAAVPGARRIRIATRLAGLLLAGNLLPLTSILMLFFRIRRAHPDPHAALEIMGASVLTYALVFIATGIVLTVVIGRNLTLPFDRIIEALHAIRGGRFDRRIPVTTSDEIGFTGDAINEMTEGLRERERMRASMGLAMEVQQNLLPRSTPEIAGLDIAGRSVYCEETGGDYFDYFEWSTAEAGSFGVAVADVSDHGLPSALLMTTARAFLRQRLCRRDDLAEVAADVNRQLVRDVEESGRYVTLFLAEVDRPALALRWVNAGHDAAMIYDRRTDGFAELGRTGLPIGVSADGGYRADARPLAPGEILLVGTDGIWEAQNARGEMFGKPRLQAVVRGAAGAPAREIITAVIAAVDAFCHPLPKADDLTLVIVKIEDLGVVDRRRRPVDSWPGID